MHCIGRSPSTSVAVITPVGDGRVGDKQQANGAADHQRVRGVQRGVPAMLTGIDTHRSVITSSAGLS